MVRERDDLNVTLVRKSLPATQEAQVPSLEEKLSSYKLHGQNKRCLWMGSLDSSARLDIQYGFSAPMFDISVETI